MLYTKLVKHKLRIKIKQAFLCMLTTCKHASCKLQDSLSPVIDLGSFSQHLDPTEVRKLKKGVFWKSA